MPRKKKVKQKENLKENDLLKDENLEEVQDEEIQIEEIEKEAKDIEKILACDIAAQYTPDKDSLDAFLKKIAKIPLLTREEEIELAKRAKKGDKEALKKLIEHNLRFVISVAKKYMGYGLPLHDLIGEGIVGLVEAARRFDPDRGVKFISYAVWWIRQAIAQALSQSTGAVKIPIKQALMASKVLKTYNELRKELSREPTLEELAEKLNMSPKEVENYLKLCNMPLSLDAPVGDEEDTTFKDFLVGSTTEDVEKAVVMKELKEAVHDLLNVLTPQERRIIIWRFGLDGNEPKTLREIGEIIGVSRERVRQLEERAKKKMREVALKKKLNVFLN